jgi:ATP-dependent Clp protease adaptor protein ClpS
MSGATTSTTKAIRPAPTRVERMPPWQVLLHNDDVNDMGYVVAAIMELTALKRREATLRMIEAHLRGLTLLLQTHREHAELLQEQFQSKRLVVTIEPAP